MLFRSHRGYSDPNYSVWAELSLTELIALALVEERYKDAEDLALSGWESNSENQFFLQTLLDLLFQRGEITRV